MAKKVVVLMGGVSSEREVSLVSGAAVAKALTSSGYDVRTVEVTADVGALLRALEPRPDVVFNALHGRFGEDGCVQGLLELLKLPYTHSGVRASAVAMDKPSTKAILASVGLQSPQGKVVSRAELKGDPMARPYIVKPVAEGSTMGVTIMRERSNDPLPASTWQFGEYVLVEEYIAGHELTVGVMGDKALDVTEIQFTTGLFDYTAKYTAGHAKHVLPAPIPKPVYEEAKRLALLAHKTLGCSGISRSDFRFDDSKPGVKGLYFLEINTQPGFTPISLLPEQAERAGISFAQLCDWLVKEARCHA
jgi:D-alanine-D-alanine ligase